MTKERKSTMLNLRVCLKHALGKREQMSRQTVNVEGSALIQGDMGWQNEDGAHRAAR